MKKAAYYDKQLIINLLTNSFQTNQSVNYLVQQDKKKTDRIRYLMDYSFEMCFNYGEVFISDDERACALILYPDQKRTSLKSAMLDVKLIFKSIGIANIKKALSRESKIKSIQPKMASYYLWFIGVDPEFQGCGIGSNLLKNVIAHSNEVNRPVFLETSTLKNLPWYNRWGFEIYHELDLGYKLFFLKRATDI
ncbi:MAG TPA: GNAT family N-acetyltransferase [Pedobacter sp.]|jgi:GNAT superfamily N-acetyltransferase